MSTPAKTTPQPKKKPKDFVKTVFFTLNMQALAVCLLSVIPIVVVIHYIEPFFYLVSDISKDLGEIITEEFKQQPNQQTATRLANRYTVGIEYRDPVSHWLTDGTAVQTVPERDLRLAGLRQYYRLSDDALLVIGWKSDFLTQIGHINALGAWIASMVAVVLGIVLLIRRTLAPLRWVQTGIEQLGQRNFTYRAPVTGNMRKDLLADGFNETAASIEKLIASKDQLIADVSHELRSPITKIKLALELPANDANLAKVKHHVNTLEEIVTSLLENQRINLQTLELKKSKVDLIKILHDVIELNRDKPPGIAPMEVQPPQATDIVIDADPQLLKLLLHNVIENALKYSEDGSAPVHIRVNCEADGIYLIIADDGVGIDDAHMDKIFEPFFKVARERGFNKGYGLGLSLCKRIADVHHWSIAMANRSPKGLQVTVEFPY